MVACSRLKPLSYNLEQLSPFQGIGQNFLVGELENTAAGNTAGQSCESDWEIGQAIGNEQCRTVPFDVWVGRHDHFREVPCTDAIDEVFDGQLIGTYPIQGCNSAKQYVIQAAKHTGLFECDQIARLLDNA